jgi:hypothetical protein
MTSGDMGGPKIPKKVMTSFVNSPYDYNKVQIEKVVSPSLALSERISVKVYNKSM